MKEKKEEDIVQLILRDHKPLKSLIKILKNEKVEIFQKESAFETFSSLLISHAKPEEQTWYVALKKDQVMRPEGFEGETEHAIADQLIEEIKKVDDEDQWVAKVKVLAELVEHHIAEEEGDMLPDYKRRSDLAERQQLGARYQELRQSFLVENGINGEGKRLSPRRKSDEIGLSKH